MQKLAKLDTATLIAELVALVAFSLGLFVLVSHPAPGTFLGEVIAICSVMVMGGSFIFALSILD